jgi:uncharacterized RDD family membrane protein YckC
MVTTETYDPNIIPENFEASNGKRIVNYVIDYFIIRYLLLAIVIYLNGKYLLTLSPGFEVLIIFVCSFFYFFLTEYYFGKTLGKLITRTTVVDEKFKSPTILILLLRTLCRFIPFEPLSGLISYKTWHDSLTKTYVVNDKREVLK